MGSRHAKSLGLPSGLPRAPGTYAVVLRCRRMQTLAVGRLGVIRFPASYYVYVGSALGPGGLRGRVRRHLRAVRRRRWHVDYLRARAVVLELWCATGRVRREHLWAHALQVGADGWVQGFGASDCRCPAHLFRFVRRPGLNALLRGAGRCDLRLFVVRRRELWSPRASGRLSGRNPKQGGAL